VQSKAPENLSKNLGIFMLGGTSISHGAEFFVAGPVLGAPMAVMALEVLMGGGAEEIVFVGFAGSLIPELDPGDYFFPDKALSSEGTSAHYQPSKNEPDPGLFKKIQEVYTPPSLFHTGTVWSTDAPFRETKPTRDFFVQKGASVVEMEVAALYAAADFREKKLAAMLLVTDSFGKGDWFDGFHHPKYKKAVKEIGDLVWKIYR
jgi:purine-nucleoside phosphorylase